VNILFLCTGNSCRSQMGEALFNHFCGDKGKAYSAGIEKHGLDPYAMKVLEELGIDLSPLYSKTLDDLSDVSFELVITVCGHAHETCPRFPGEARVEHHPFEDPPRLIQGIEDEEEKLKVFRRVRDEILHFLQQQFI